MWVQNLYITFSNYSKIGSFVYKENDTVLSADSLKEIEYNPEISSVFELASFEIDDKGSELIAFILSTNTGEKSALIFQKNKHDHMNLVFPLDFQLANNNYHTIYKIVSFLKYPGMKLNAIPTDKQVFYIMIGNNYQNRNIDDHFFVEVLAV